jgi:hypothetical protein
MKSVSKLSLLGLLALGLTASPLMAADERSEQGATFEGKISSFDKSAQTMVVDGQTYQLLPTTRVTKQDRTASSTDLAVGQQVDGTYKRSAEDKREVLVMDISKDAEKQVGGTRDQTTTMSGATFRGRVSRIDKSAQTLRVGDRTYQVLPTTTITRASGGTATLADVKQDQRVSGTYKESSEGKMEIISMEIGRDALR